MKLAYSAVVLALAATVAAPATAQTEAELRQQLEAQKAINEQLRKRVEELEGQLVGAPAAPALRPLEPRPAALEPETVETTTAIQEALIAKGLVLLPPGSFRLGPAFAWAHTGADALHTRSDSYTGSLTAQAGLPWGMMLTANAPYTHRDTSIGSNSGFGDLSISLSKQLTSESEHVASFVASLGYIHDNGEDPFAPVPIGFGFRVLGGTLSALKRVDPLVVYGSLSYSHAYAEDVSAENFLGEPGFTGRIAPGDSWGYRLGTSLAATPEITLDASLSGSFIRGADVRSDEVGRYTLPKATLGFINLGAGFLLSRNLSLLVNASAGVTEDSPDFIFAVSSPYRF